MSSTDILQLLTSALNLGVLGVVFWLFVGGKLHASSEMERVTADRDRLAGEKASAVADAVASARTDLIEENRRLIEEKRKAEDQRDAALKIAQEQIVPLLASFVSTTSALLPLLQELVSMREDFRHRRPGD